PSGRRTENSSSRWSTPRRCGPRRSSSASTGQEPKSFAGARAGLPQSSVGPPRGRGATMSCEYLPLVGELVDARSLRIPKALELARAVGSGSVLWASLVECRRYDGRDGSPGGEAVVIDLDIEMPQDVVHDIRRRERVAVAFEP